MVKASTMISRELQTSHGLRFVTITYQDCNEIVFEDICSKLWINYFQAYDTPKVSIFARKNISLALVYSKFTWFLITFGAGSLVFRVKISFVPLFFHIGSYLH